MGHKNILGMPKHKKITGLNPTVTHAFITSFIPRIRPTDEELGEALRILGMARDDIRCAYCGDPATQWDHLRPLTKGGKPTGYITEIHNLVPACGRCNQSKRNEYWRDWISSKVWHSPQRRGVPDLEQRITHLEAYEIWGHVEPIDFQRLVGPDLWERCWASRRRLFDLMKECQAIAEEVRTAIEARHQHDR